MRVDRTGIAIIGPTIMVVAGAIPWDPKPVEKKEPLDINTVLPTN